MPKAAMSELWRLIGNNVMLNLWTFYQNSSVKVL
jgi:hypothetical protein